MIVAAAFPIRHPGFRQGFDFDQSAAGRKEISNSFEFLDQTETSPMENWQPVAEAPFGQDLELAVLERGDAHALVFPCRRTQGGWVDPQTGLRVDVNPTHWRVWPGPTST